MMKRKSSLIISAIVLSFSFNTDSHGQGYRTSLEIRAPHEVESVTINGEPTVFYELHLVNFSRDTLEVRSLDVKDSLNSKTVFSINDFRRAMRRVGSSNADSTNLISPGSASVVFLEYALANPGSTQLTHRITLGNRNSQELYSVQSEEQTSVKSAPITLGKPLSGGPWAAVFSRDWETGHRRMYYTVNGRARIPGRFAIDFFKMDQKGLHASGDPDKITNWHGYNAEVLAVADGVVSSVDDGFSESATISAHPRPTGEKGAGNYISIKIEDNVYAFYEHLKPGSIRVKAGQAVKKGEVIANLGFTGSTQGPHLHFHLGNKNSPLGAEGIPFVFESFELIGAYNDFERFGKNVWDTKGIKTGSRKKERPMPNAVVVFD